MIRPRNLIVAAAAAALLLAGCSPGGKAKPVAEPGVEASGEVEFWHFFTDREAAEVEKVLKDFEAKHPKVKLTTKSGQDDGKTIQAISAGQGPDVALSYSTDMVGRFCNSGAWRDLKPFVDRDKVDLGKLPEISRKYTEHKGKRCAMPALADAYGLYFNKQHLAEAGVTNPPKTLDELTDAAKKLTKRKPDGTIERAGFMPLLGFYEHTAEHLAPMTGAKWLKDDGTSAIGGDEAWAQFLTWQKQLVDWYGHANLEKFRSGLGDEWSADNAFHKGKVAMQIDGEYRIAFLKDQAKDIQFGTAPMPVAKSELQGSGYISGNVMGINRNAKNPEAAWALIKYLTTNKDAMVKLANAIKNLPTHADALTSPDLKMEPEFKTFVEIFKHPKSSHTPTSNAGPAYLEEAQKFCDQWQAGKVANLESGLKDLDKRIDALVKVGG